MEQGINYDKKVNKGLLIFGYIYIFLGGIIGIIVGFYLLFATVKLENGIKVREFDQESRKHGAFIIVVAIIFLLLYLTLFDQDSSSLSSHPE